MLRWDSMQLVLPLGARDGEFQVTLEMRAGARSAQERRALSERAERRLLYWEDAWARGAFRLQAAQVLVGELHFLGEEPPALALYDPSWMTRGMVQVSEVTLDGPEWVLRVPIMPRLEGEVGLLRVNRPMAQLVVPFGAEPTPYDRVLSLVPGPVSEVERQASVAAALQESGRRETELVLGLMAQAFSEVQGCPVPLSEPLAQLLQGYTFTPSPSADGRCEVLVEPVEVQHGRRLSARVGADGVHAQILRELDLDFRMDSLPVEPAGG